MLKLRYLFSFCLVVLFLAVLARSAAAEEAKSDPILVELFTSEGCSDCPPADAFLKVLDSMNVPGVQLVVLEEHVDYWDDQGWRDPFSSHDLTVRQNGYVDEMHLKTAFTPQMVIDGTYQLVGSDRQNAAKDLDNARSTEKTGLRISNVQLSNGTVHFHVETDSVPEKVDLIAALALEHAESQVQRGENGGHRLEHVAVVRNLEKIGKAEKGKSISQDFSLSAKSFSAPGRLVVFLQQPHEGKVIGAALDRIQN